jgi:hypothetical protein
MGKSERKGVSSVNAASLSSEGEAAFLVDL